MRNSNTSYDQVQMIRASLSVLFEPRSVVELRAFRGRQTASGYFDDHDLLAENAAKLDRGGFEVYTTLNEVDSALLARAANRVEPWAKTTTGDHDIVRRRRLLVDFDPARPSGICATEEEKRAAVERADEVQLFLDGHGWPKPVAADPGNGAHLVYGIDLPNDRASSDLVRNILECLAFLFDDARVRVDTGVYNAARLIRLYGTTNRKGDDTAERPHRLSRIVSVPKE